MKALVLDNYEIPAVWEVLDDEAGHFGDNGGDPDGNRYISPDVSERGETAVIAASFGEMMEVEEVPYFVPLHDYRAESFDWCGYQSNRVAYILTGDRNDFIKAQIETALEDDPEAVDAWHDGEAEGNDTIQRLIHWFGAFHVYGGGDNGTEPLSIVYPG